MSMELNFYLIKDFNIDEIDMLDTAKVDKLMDDTYLFTLNQLRSFFPASSELTIVDLHTIIYVRNSILAAKAERERYKSIYSRMTSLDYEQSEILYETEYWLNVIYVQLMTYVDLIESMSCEGQLYYTYD